MTTTKHNDSIRHKMTGNPSLMTLDEFRSAQQRIKGVTLHTPLVRLQVPDHSGNIFIKPEGLQPIGSFKLRGAYNKIAQLSDADRQRGVIAYSSGNHAQGVAYAAQALGVKAIIIMPSTAPETKKRATAALGAEIVEVGPSSSERRQKAEELASEFGYVIVPPYDDRAIIAGQGTCGLEILADLPGVDLVLCPVGGGGLVSGVATAIKLIKPEVRIIGVEPELAADAQESFRSGNLATWPAELTTRTMADGLRTQSIGNLNFELIRAYVDDIITVQEEEIAESLRTLLYQARLTPEPSGAVTTAAALFHLEELLPFRNSVAIMSGGNVDPDILQKICQPHQRAG